MTVRPLEHWDVERNGTALGSTTVPCTVASLLRDRGEWQPGDSSAFDDETWTFRCRIAGGPETQLECDGLTPGAIVTLNGEHLATSTSMYRALHLPVTLAAENLLEITFSPLTHPARKPRARWRTQLFDQKWRWVRTTAIGRMPSWGAMWGTIGPWRGIRLRQPAVRDVRMRVELDGTDGVVHWSGTPVNRSAGTLRLGDQVASLRGDAWQATLRVRNAERWWPHTHGLQPRYLLLLDDGVWAEQVAFREVERIDPLAFRINGIEVFCRGACWVPSDPVSLGADPRADIALARQAHCNMLRVSANTIYESDAFYEACDAQGMLVWQDFMFASFDYPFADAEFAEHARAESAEFLARTQARACLTVLCGNSEVEMQALLVGQPIDTPPFFAETLAKECASARPDVPYLTGTPGGSSPVVLPGEGWSHYYGVGLFNRPMSDARLSNVRFAPESLGMVQLPARASRAAWTHVPWQSRIDRNSSGTGDLLASHLEYLRQLYDVDPATLPGTDPALWEALNEIMVGTIMTSAYSEWRTQSRCRGALVWRWRDIWKSWDLGLVDAAGRPKAAMHYLRRVLAPRAVLLSDEGLNGLAIHLLNERDTPIESLLSIDVFAGSARVEGATRVCAVPARGHEVLTADELLGRFADITQAWGLGAAAGDVVVVRWGDAPPAFHFPRRWPRPVPTAVGLSAQRDGDAVIVRTRDFAHTVVIDADTEPSDSYFHLAPGMEHRVHTGPGPIRVSALGATERIDLP